MDLTVVWSGHLSGTFAHGPNGLFYVRGSGPTEPDPPCPIIDHTHADPESVPVLVGADGTWLLEHRHRQLYGFDCQRVSIPGGTVQRAWACLDNELPSSFSFLNDDSILYLQGGHVRCIDTWGNRVPDVDDALARLRYDHGDAVRFAGSGGMLVVQFEDDRRLKLFDQHGRLLRVLGDPVPENDGPDGHGRALDHIWFDSKYRVWLLGSRLEILDLQGTILTDVPSRRFSGYRGTGYVRVPIGVGHDGLLWVMEPELSPCRYFAVRLPGTEGSGLAPTLGGDDRTGLEPTL